MRAASCQRVIEDVLADAMLGPAKSLDEVMRQAEPIIRAQAEVARAADALQSALAGVSWATLDIPNSIRASSDAVLAVSAAARAAIDWEFIEARIWRQEVREAFGAAGFVPSPFMDDDLREAVVEAHKTTSDSESLAQLIVVHYEANNSEALEMIVDRLLANELFQGRTDVLRQTLAAHRRIGEYDAISAYPLVAMIEGIVMRFLVDYWRLWEEEPAKRKPPKPRHRHMFEVLRAVIGAIRTAPVLDDAQIMADYLQEHFLAPFDVASNDQHQRITGDVQRHALLHGHSYRADRTHTLRCFLILDCLGALLPYAANELDEIYQDDRPSDY